MSRYEDIYREHAKEYDELVRHEDRERNVSRWFTEQVPSRPSLCIELGAGTGRLTRMLAARAVKVHAYDGSAHMVDFARTAVAAENATFAVADHARIPEPDLAAELVVAGWTFGHAIGATPQGWEKIIEDVLHEMMRLVAPGGQAVILETLGTCVDAPVPPNPALGAYYTLLERWYGFTRTTIATDYTFETNAEAQRVLGFFFGEEMVERVAKRGTSIIPEFTGIWTRKQTRT